MSASSIPAYRTQRPVRILSLDSGGIRGLASLFVLQDLMDRIKVQEKLAEMPLPCEWFDLIVGTSTGGIIALMLGRLEMPVNMAIDAYQGLAEVVFGADTKAWRHLRRRHTFTHTFKYISGESLYSADKLEAALREVAGDAKLADPLAEPKCRVAVVAVRQEGPVSSPDVFRTYATDVAPYDCTIVEASRATSATRMFFPPANFQIRYGREVKYLDGGLEFSNPTRLAVEEAEQIWGYGSLGCIVSIGTGVADYVRHEGNEALARKLLEISTSSMAVHQRMKRRFEGMQNPIYFRFNPPSDETENEWKGVLYVAQLAHAYVHQVQKELSACVTALTHPNFVRPQEAVREAEPLHIL